MDESFMKEKPVPRLVLTMSLPMVLSMLVNSLYNIIDSYFVARISEDAMTALSLVYPVQNIINAVVIGFGVGINAAVAFYLGAGQKDKADQSATLGFFFNGVHGLVLGAVCTLIMPFFLSFYTEDPVITEYALNYSRIVFAFAFINACQLSFEKIFQAVGRMTVSMLAMLTGCITNIILDPMLIFGIGFFPEMGIKGAALATGIGQSVPVAVYLIIYIVKPTTARLRIKSFSFKGKITGRLYKVGAPAALNLAFPSFLISALNAILASFGEVYVLVLGVYYKLQTFLYLTSNGIVQGIRPLISYNYGAGEYQRVKQVYKTALLAAAVIMAVGTILCLTVPYGLFGLFTDSEETALAGAKALRIICAGFIVSSVSVITCGCFEALGKGGLSLIISLLRYVVIIIPAAFILSRFFGPAGVWNSFWIAELITAGVSFVLYQKKIARPKDQAAKG